MRTSIFLLNYKNDIILEVSVVGLIFSWFPVSGMHILPVPEL